MAGLNISTFIIGPVDREAAAGRPGQITILVRASLGPSSLIRSTSLVRVWANSMPSLAPIQVSLTRSSSMPKQVRFPLKA